MKKISLYTITLLLLLNSFAMAALIPYQNSGTENLATYTFSAKNSGDILAYFTGSNAGYSETIGILINGVLSTKGFGLNNHESNIGDQFILGTATAGDILTLVLNIYDNSAYIYSDKNLNNPYDKDNIAHNHIYSTPYMMTDSGYSGIPSGTYVAFEDLPATESDWNYFDETFVLTNVVASPTPLATPEGNTLILLGIGLVGLGLAIRR